MVPEKHKTIRSNIKINRKENNYLVMSVIEEVQVLQNLSKIFKSSTKYTYIEFHSEDVRLHSNQYYTG